jgi:adenine-specific DNA-methyltransferase
MNNLVFMDFLKANLGTELIDLIYFDPPFYSGVNYKSRKKINKKSDLSNDVINETFSDKWNGGIDEYLSFLETRIKKSRELLSPKGVMAVHLDWHVVHYVKVLMDKIFGYNNFVNEIIWHYKKMASSTQKFMSNHDVILVYSNKKKHVFNPVREQLQKPVKRLVREMKNGRLINKKGPDGNVRPLFGLCSSMVTQFLPTPARRAKPSTPFRHDNARRFLRAGNSGITHI